MSYRPGRHGSMASSELEHIILRNSQFLTVSRAGDGDGRCGLLNAITGKFIQGVGGGRIPEYSLYRKTAPSLVRGWRNILYELLHKRHLLPTPAVCALLGTEATNRVRDYGLEAAPMGTPEPDMQRHGNSWI